MGSPLGLTGSHQSNSAFVDALPTVSGQRTCHLRHPPRLLIGRKTSLQLGAFAAKAQKLSSQLAAAALSVIERMLAQKMLLDAAGRHPEQANDSFRPRRLRPARLLL